MLLELMDSGLGISVVNVTGARFTKYLSTNLRLSYDNAKVMIDLRWTSNLLSISRRMEGFSQVRLTCRIIVLSEIVFIN